MKLLSELTDSVVIGWNGSGVVCLPLGVPGSSRLELTEPFSDPLGCLGMYIPRRGLNRC